MNFLLNRTKQRTWEEKRINELFYQQLPKPYLISLRGIEFIYNLQYGFFDNLVVRIKGDEEEEDDLKIPGGLVEGIWI